MADLERVYNIPLRKEVRNAPAYKRAKRAITAVQDFLKRHMKSDKILLGQELNMAIWARGIKHPPHHVKVTVKKDSEGVVRAELFGKEFAIVKQKAQKKEDTSLMGKLKHKMGVTDEEEEEKPAEKKEAPKKEEKPAEKKEEKPVEKKEAPKKEEPKKEAAAPKPAHKAEPKQQTLAAEKPAKKD